MFQETLTPAPKYQSSTDLSRIKRLEDVRFLTGRAKYTDDIKPDNLAYMGLVRSNYAYARIKGIDFSKAKENPAFIVAITGEDLLKFGVGTVYELEMPGIKRTPRYQLAVSKVRFVGEPVVAFLSSDRYSVEDIAEDIGVEYEPLSPVLGIDESQSRKSLIYEEWGNNILLENTVRRGDAQTALKGSSHVVKAHFGVKRQSGVAIEPRVVIASFDKAKGIYEIFSSIQNTHRLKAYLSSELKTTPDRFHVTVLDVGGAFGGKGAHSYPEPSLACILSEKTGFTVKWASTRTEDLLETAQARDEYCDIELACDSNARITALIASIVSDGGVGGTLKSQPMLSARRLPGAYKIPNLEIKSTSYATNKPPGGPVRGAGRPEGIFFIESIMDKMAKHLLLDPMGFRRLNMIQRSDYPYENGTGDTYDNGDFARLLDSLKGDYNQLQEWRRKVNATNSELLAGVSIALLVEDTGAQLSETAKIVASANEKTFFVYSGSTPQGQGLETTLAILASEELSVPIDQIKVKFGDSNALPTSIGTFGSRSIVTGGSAVVDACRKFKEEIRSEASKLFSIPKEEIQLEGEKLLKRNANGRPEVLADLWEFLRKLGKNVEAYSNFSLKSLTFATGAHICAVTVDRETGKVKIHKYVVADDCGRVINELIVDGQLHGGVVHGIGDMLLSEIPHNDDGVPLATNFVDYMIPTSLDVPDIEVFHEETLSTLSLNGAKGVGESGTIGAFPAVISAVNNALQGIGEVTTAPVAPEDIYKALHHE